MGNFLAILAPEAFREEARLLFRSGLGIARETILQVSNQTVETDWSSVALFPRQNGSGGSIVSDPETGSWLLALGTWFHEDDISDGNEGRLLQRYLRVGAAQLGLELEGFFTVAVGDGRTREVVVITDVVGSCHCFVRLLHPAMAVSGSSLVLAGLQAFALDPIGCQEFLRTGVIYQDRTLYKEVRKLGPARVFSFSEAGLRREQRYWDQSTLKPESLDGNTAVSLLWESLTRATQKVTHRFSRTVCDLTGGYDSRAMVAAFLDSSARITTTVSGPADSLDVSVSRGLAHLAKLPHLHFPAQGQRSFSEIKQALAYTDGEYDLVEYARILGVHRALAEQFDISINGSFGEIARGYWWEILIPQTGRRRRLDAARLARLRYAPQSSTANLFAPEAKLKLVPHFAQIIDQANFDLFSTPNTFQLDHTYLVMRMQRWQGRLASSTNRVWPCLSPFMFRSVLEIMLQTKTSLRKRSLLVRKMLARFQPRLAQFPLEHGYPALPVTLTTLPRFSPLFNYYADKVLQRAGLKSGTPESSGPSHLRLQLWQDEEVRELLNPASMRVAALFDVPALRTFLSYSQREHFDADREWTRLLTLEYALRQASSSERYRNARKKQTLSV